jgi:Protein of unknown function (DUF3800)
VLVCYLDDSGKDPQSRITNIGGYIAREDEWKTFESEVEPWFSEFGVNVLHAKLLHDTDGDFKNWTVLRKQSFVARIFQVASRHVPLGLAAGAVKDAYENGVVERGERGLRTVRPYTFCFNLLIDWILTDIRIGREANTDGVSFIIEAGHENNPEAEQQFHDIRKRHKLENVLRSICFVPKVHSRAIQIADLLAFYSRRYGALLENLTPAERDGLNPGTIINVMSERIPHRTYVANSFDPKVGSRFLAGEPS